MGGTEQTHFTRKVLRIFRGDSLPKYSPAWPLLPPHGGLYRPEMILQHQSPLFGKLSAELRLAIYECAFGDPVRFMHIFQDTGGKRRMAHRRCRDTESLYPTWQHSCFGKWTEEDGEMYCLETTITEDSMFSFLISCHRIYSEALEVLYISNTFHFRRASDVVATYHTMPSIQWDTIRRIHFSAVFQVSIWLSENPRKTWSENLKRWNQCCELLKGSHNLNNIRLDLIIRPGPQSLVWTGIQDDSLILLLKPLQGIVATVFEVELNVDVPESALQVLGPVSFNLITKKRPYNSVVFDG